MLRGKLESWQDDGWDIAAAGGCAPPLSLSLPALSLCHDGWNDAAAGVLLPLPPSNQRPVETGPMPVGLTPV
jgi:hypothetical protein